MIWRNPDEESVGLYPGLVVDDGRATGSITAGRTRLPLWAFITDVILEGKDAAWHGYDVGEHGLTPKDLAHFLYCLLELRGEFGRLLLVLANEERMERALNPWWERKTGRRRVRKQLQRCLDAIKEPQEPETGSS